MKKTMITLVLALAMVFTIDAVADSKYKIDTDNSIINWEGKKVTGKHFGIMKFDTGWIELEGNDLTGGEFHVDMRSVESHDLKDNPSMKNKLEGHLKSDDFFNAEKYPTSKFVIKKAEKVKEYGGSVKYNVTGDLTIRGKTHSYTFPVTLTKSNNKIYASVLLTFDRANHDVKYGSGSFFDSLGDKIIYDEIPLDMSIIFVENDPS